ncbi:hypothetical protein EMCRGX_G021237 [Ephydatia muelleri]|eukprot:Em0016g1104a
MPRSYRQKRVTEEEEDQAQDEQDDVSKKVEEAKQIQSFRKRPAGVSAVGLAFGKKFSDEEKIAPDPFKLKSGGLVDLKNVKNSDMDGVEDEVVKRLHSTFSAETNTRDDETHMLQYIEDELAKKKGSTDKPKEVSEFEAKINELYAVPDRLNIKINSLMTEEMLSNQMLSGIPEVDLGLEAKFKNIEETEEAKQKLAEEQMKKKSGGTSLVPTNIASNFTLHSLRFYKDKSLMPRREAAKEPEQPAYIPVVGENEPELRLASAREPPKRKQNEQAMMATDDYHFDKYKKKAKRY